MGTVFRKTFTKPVPADAESFERKGQRFARWKDRRGKTRTARLTLGKDGTERLLLESPCFVAKYRDGAGIVRELATGCRDETAARQVLADLEREAELIRSKVITAAEAAIGKHQTVALTAHIDLFEQNLKAAGVTTKHARSTRAYVVRLAGECGFACLSDLRRECLEAWLVVRTKEAMSARTRNAHRDALVAFCNWCVSTNRLTVNPFKTIPKAIEKADPRRRRRAMGEAELVKLLVVAEKRPLIDALTVRTGKRKGQLAAKVRSEVRLRLELLGHERALIYKTLVLTGLRKGELASLTVGHVNLDDVVPCLSLDAADEKNREGNDIPLRDDLAADLGQWLADKLCRLQTEVRLAGEPIPARLPPATPLFKVPEGLVKIMDRDLRLAGIAKRDERGRILDVHALRTTFGTLLSKGGVTPRTAQAAMRHSKIDLTMNVYTDPALLDVRAALNALPSLPLGGAQDVTRELAKATGTEDLRPRTLAPVLAPTHDKTMQSQSFPVSLAAYGHLGQTHTALTVTPSGDKRKEPPSFPDSGSRSGGEGIRTPDRLATKPIPSINYAVGFRTLGPNLGPQFAN
jgi:integrase